MICNNFSSGFCREITLTVNKISSVSGAGIPGAVFQLTSCNCHVRTGTTGQNGSLALPLLPCNTYTLTEVSAPPGYMPESRVYNINVDACGNIFVDGVFTTRLDISNTPLSASFMAVKVNQLNGVRLMGAVYTLYMNGTSITSAVSDIAGHITFTGLLPGTYRLVETTPPPGFQANADSLTVVVASNGSVTINGQPANGFVLNDIPLGDFSFLKLNASTGMPLAGATFTLSQNGTVAGTAVSDAQGLVNFGTTAAGAYQLVETAPPAGFQPNATVYQAVVAADGSITVNGTALDDFTVANTPILISAPPVINAPVEESSIVSGTGVPGATVTVTLPNGLIVNAVVAANGSWAINVPAGVLLIPGEMISAVQQEPGKLVSRYAYATIIAAVEPFLQKSVENLTSPGEDPAPGDLLQFTILIGNLGGQGSVWYDAVMSDTFIDALTFVPGTVAIDGQPIPTGSGVGQYLYDSATRTLTVSIGDLTSGMTKTITLQTIVNPDATGEITNTATAVSTGLLLANSAP